MSADNWDADDFQSPDLGSTSTGVDRWEGEDEHDIPDDWMAADESKSSDTPKQAPLKKKKSLADRIAEKEMKRREEVELRRQEEEAAFNNLSTEQQLAEKLRSCHLQEESDLELAREAFGVSDTPETGVGTSALDVSPSTKEEFDEFRQALVDKLRSLESRPLYTSFLDELVRDACWNLDSDDVKKISSSLSALYNEKVKSKQKGKKKKGAKLNVERTAVDEFEDFL